MARPLFLIPIVSLLFSCLNIYPAAAQAVPLAGATAVAPAVGLDAIAAYAGTWQTEVQYQDTAYSKKSEDKHQLHNECWRSAGYYACDQFVDGASKALLIFMYDPAKGYTSYPIPAEGTATVHSGRLVIDGKVWTFPWEVENAGKTTYFHVVNTWTSPDSIEFRQEYSEDGKQWKTMAQGHESRVKG